MLNVRITSLSPSFTSEISLLVFSSLMFLISLCSIIHMLSFKKKLTFEFYILTSGLLENSFYLLFKLLHNNIFSDLQDALQEVINLSIIFRFSLIFLKYQKKVSKKMIYVLFFSLVTIIVVLEMVYFLDIYLDFIEYINVYHTFLSVFYVCISICLVIFGFYLKKLIRQSLIDSYITQSDFSLDQNDMKRSSLNPRKVKELETKEIYYSTRIKQINIVIYSNFVTDSVELLIDLFSSYLATNQFELTSSYLYSRTMFGWAIIFVDDLCALVVTFTNYIAFYFIIRNSYRNVRKPELTPSLIKLNVDQAEKDDIKEYLSFYTTAQDLPEDFSIVD